MPPKDPERFKTIVETVARGSLNGLVKSSRPIPEGGATPAAVPPVSGFIPIANGAATVTDDTNPGFGGTATIAVLTLPADVPALAIKLAGDTFPRLVIMADSADGIYLGNGSDDLSTTFANILMDSGGKLTVGVAGTAPGVQFLGGAVTVQGNDVRFPQTGSGPVVTDTVTGTQYRLTVASGVVTPVVA
jgi:hypothetical protein